MARRPNWLPLSVTLVLVAVRSTILFVCLCLLTGCRYIVSEPYPDFAYGSVPAKELPKPVAQAFAARHAGAHIERVETECFKGKVGEYRIWFRSQDGKVESAIFDRNGQPMPAPGPFRNN